MWKHAGSTTLGSGGLVTEQPDFPLTKLSERRLEGTPATGVELPLVDLARQYRSIKDEVDAALLEAVASTDYVLGEELARFEEDFAAYCGARWCVGVSSGTAALHLILEALDVSPGDELIVPANTFFGTVAPMLRLGATPVLVDCDEETFTIDVEAAAAAIGPRTRGVVAVHLYGHTANMAPLHELCGQHGLFLVEDAAQAHGARYRGGRTGGLGTAAAFSFYPSKNLGAYGDGGAVTTDDNELASRIGMLRNLGQSSKYVHRIEGSNERLDTIQAAVLRVKLRHLDRWNARRRKHVETYREALEGTGVATPAAASWAEHVWHVFAVRSPRRDELRSALAAERIGTGMHYPVPLHLQPALAPLALREGAYPVTEALANELLSLPMFPELEPTEIRRVADTVGDSVRAAAETRI
jgi:dTDP-4-amino-4,6-dideoxygalactose transaminase